MTIKIITPEYVVFEGSVNSILLPGKQGEFHIFKNHAAIVSALVNGHIKIYTEEISAQYSKYFTKEDEANTAFSFPIRSGVLEFNNDKGIILCE
ncbi:F0F1 ATP synthase subunit epsilon [Chryseobacterium sp. POL2]|uniref:F0F1 ATP synthase subunit epsilon n=1 Tax=Chryseobacterium sp. POL2 TaxID=2713414 RepID=UPI0013E1EE4C|nr:F0F1 ATP synthase subunit epsilon [Chryseobacterium sp. POL2]QIG88425.1 F0F1 ATP synthase subunit epsilon [Chryseobacterium sp. POL2]